MIQGLCLENTSVKLLIKPCFELILSLVLIGLVIIMRWYKTEAGGCCERIRAACVERETNSENNMPPSADQFITFENVSRQVLQPSYRFVPQLYFKLVYLPRQQTVTNTKIVQTAPLLMSFMHATHQKRLALNCAACAS